MTHGKKFIGVLFFSLVFYASCLQTSPAGASMSVRAGIEIYSGSAIVRIDGRVNENLHVWSIFHESQDARFNDPPAIREGTITRNETRVMAAGEVYMFSVLPTETVTINVRSSDGSDVELIVHRQGREEKRTITGANMLGATIGFHNR